MKPMLLLTGMLAFCVLMAAVTIRPDHKVTKRLSFECVGPADASIQPFSVEVGRITATNRRVVFVTQDTYDSIVAIVKRAGSSKDPGSQAGLQFHVTAFTGEKAGKAYTIYPPTIVLVMRRLSKMFEVHHSQTPAFIVALTKL